jgi:acetoin utilization protein AcuB
MQASEIMTRHPEVIEHSEPIRNALERFHDNDFRHLPVMREGQLIGILSSRDVRGLSFLSHDARYEKLLDKPVSGFMSTGLVTVNEGSEVSELLDIFIEGKVGAVPVIDGHTNKLVGIVSYIDVLTALRGALE